MGRNFKQYEFMGKRLTGLSKIGPNRWRISQTGERFSESDEYRAIQHFLQETAEERDAVFIPIAQGQPVEMAEKIDSLSPELEGVSMRDIDGKKWDEENAIHEIGHNVDRKAMWAWFRNELLNNPELVAQETGIPQLATFASLRLPKEPIPVQLISDTYLEFSTAQNKHSKTAAIKCWQRMVEFTEARTLADLTTEKLLAFADNIAANDSLDSDGTRRAYIRRAKTVLKFALTRGIDNVQVSECLARMEVLNPKRFDPPVIFPHPISQEDFNKLLNAAVGENAHWRKWLICGMNLCLHMIDLCKLKWSYLDLSAGTYRTIREKTKRARVPQCAMLWPETIEILRGLKNETQYVFVNRLGQPWKSKTRIDQFAEFRDAAGVTARDEKDNLLSWDWIRDGAYTAAITGGNETWARVLAGHRAPGLQDSYVLRNAKETKVATDAVYGKYFG